MSGTEDPRPYAVVTVTDVFEKVMSLEGAIIALTTRVDTVVVDHSGRLNDHESRIRGLERKLWLVSGAAAVLGGTLAKFLPVLGTS